MYRMCCWYIITGNVILCYFFFSVAPFAPLLKYTCYMCNRQGAHKSHRISSSLCSHDNALPYLYWYLHFMLIWSWCILSYVWWEALKLFWIFWILNDDGNHTAIIIFTKNWSKESIDARSGSSVLRSLWNLLGVRFPNQPRNWEPSQHNGTVLPI